MVSPVTVAWLRNKDEIRKTSSHVTVLVPARGYIHTCHENFTELKKFNDCSIGEFSYN